MYHTLHVASKSMSFGRGAGAIPPILSCESASSVGSNPNNFGSFRKENLESSMTPLSPSGSNSIFVGRQGGVESVPQGSKPGRKNEKELPVWLIGMFLLLHCEEEAFLRNVSGEDERRFDSKLGRRGQNSDILQPLRRGIDTGNSNMALSPRTRLHAGIHIDNGHLSRFILCHIRKFLLLAALPNPDALSAISSLINIIPSTNTNLTRNASIPYPPPAAQNLSQINLQHDRDHSNIGTQVNLSTQDIEKLSFVLHPPNGGLIMEQPVRLRDYLFETSNKSTFSLVELELLVRKQLELDLTTQNPQDDINASSQRSMTKVTDTMQSLQLKDANSNQPQTMPSGYNKELVYTNIHGQTTILKPTITSDLQDDIKSTTGSVMSNTSGGIASSTISNASGGIAGVSRLHDLTISGCSEAHMYLLQPFENATITACTGCTIVVGAVAGLLHVVDCENTLITSAARRLLICNSFNVLNCCFTPSAPLLLGDNRSCQFAPYNTYYDGLREDLLTTGLAAVCLDHGSSLTSQNFLQEVSPALQCASNKWKQPMELSKLGMSQVRMNHNAQTAESSPRGERETKEDEHMHTTILQPASEFSVLFVPFETDYAKQRRQQIKQATNPDDDRRSTLQREEKSTFMEESQYCHNLADILQLSPFRLPTEYERWVLFRAERIRTLQQAMQTDLTQDQQCGLEEELYKEFRDWLVTSGNLRQVLDLVRLEKEQR